MQKSLVMILMSVGFILGGYIPLLWGAGLFSVSSLLLGALGGGLGIWAGYKLSQ